jgi:hypothetical protein
VHVGFSLGRLLPQQPEQRRARLGPAEASESTSGSARHVEVKVPLKIDENGNHRRRCADASASAGTNAGVSMPQEVKPDVRRQIGTKMHGSRDCRNETGTLNDTRDNNPDDRLARRRAANHGKRFQRCELFRNGATGAKADEPPAKTLKRRNRRGKPAPSGFGSELCCVGDPRIRYRFDQGGIVRTGRRQGLLTDSGGRRAALGRSSAFGKEVELPGGHATRLHCESVVHLDHEDYHKPTKWGTRRAALTDQPIEPLQ